MNNTSPKLWKSMLKSAATLGLYTIVGIGLLLFIMQLTREDIRSAEQKKVLSTFNQVLPKTLYDNNPLKDTLKVTNPTYLGTSSPVKIYRARKNGHPVGVIFEITAPDGYSGNIDILVAVLANHTISGVRVLKHHETPGLGDKIEIKKSNWITEFNGKSIKDPKDSAWHVKKDGGEFDQFTGATITPRAVVKAVKKALIFVNQQGEKLYE
jgi:electron transport complex protein RnfG